MPKVYVDSETGELVTPYLDENGREVLSSIPMAPPVGYKREPSLWEQMRAVVRHEMSQAASAAGAESFEEADDFDVGEDFDPSSPYEEHFDPVPVSELRRRSAEHRAEPGQAADSAASPPSDGPGSSESETPSPKPSTQNTP